MPGKLKKLTEEQARQSVKLYDSGESLAVLAKKFGVSRQSMWELLRRRTKLRSKKRTGSQNHFYRGGSIADDSAQNKVEKAVAKGLLVRPDKCENCGVGGSFSDGRPAIQAHHDDYNKPLDVRWLCQKCHHAWHRDNKAVPLQARQAFKILMGIE